MPSVKGLWNVQTLRGSDRFPRNQRFLIVDTPVQRSACLPYEGCYNFAMVASHKHLSLGV